MSGAILTTAKCRRSNHQHGQSIDLASYYNSLLTESPLRLLETPGIQINRSIWPA